MDSYATSPFGDTSYSPNVNPHQSQLADVNFQPPVSKAIPNIPPTMPPSPFPEPSMAQTKLAFGAHGAPMNVPGGFSPGSNRYGAIGGGIYGGAPSTPPFQGFYGQGGSVGISPQIMQAILAHPLTQQAAREVQQQFQNSAPRGYSSQPRNSGTNSYTRGTTSSAGNSPPSGRSMGSGKTAPNNPQGKPSRGGTAASQSEVNAAWSNGSGKSSRGNTPTAASQSEVNAAWNNPAPQPAAPKSNKTPAMKDNQAPAAYQPGGSEYQKTYDVIHPPTPWNPPWGYPSAHGVAGYIPPPHIPGSTPFGTWANPPVYQSGVNSPYHNKYIDPNNSMFHWDKGRPVFHLPSW